MSLGVGFEVPKADSRSKLTLTLLLLLPLPCFPSPPFPLPADQDIALSYLGKALTILSYKHQNQSILKGPTQ